MCCNIVWPMPDMPADMPVGTPANTPAGTASAAHGDRLRYRDLAAYGALALPLAFGGVPLYIHAPDFYAADLGLSLATLGITLGWLRLLDALLDPLVGWASDRWPEGRRALVGAGAAVLVLGMAALFMPPGVWLLGWFAATMALTSLGHSLISVNLLTLGGLWRRNDAQKARISAWREGFGLIGLIAGTVLPAVLWSLYGRQAALLVLAGVLALLLAATLPGFLGWAGRTRLQLTPRGGMPNWRALLPFYAVAGLVLLSAALPALLILMLVRDLLGAEILSGLFLLIYFTAALPGAALAGWLAGRFGALRVWGAALAASAAAFAWALTLGPGDVMVFAAICLATGFCFGADLVLPPAILSARVQATATEHAAGRAYAALSLLSKAALALASVIALPWLDAAGFRPAGENGAEALRLLLLLYAGIPLALRLLAIAALAGFHRKGWL